MPYQVSYQGAPSYMPSLHYRIKALVLPLLIFSPSLLCCHPRYLSEPSLIMHLFVWKRHKKSIVSIKPHTHNQLSICNRVVLNKSRQLQVCSAKLIPAARASTSILLHMFFSFSSLLLYCKSMHKQPGLFWLFLCYVLPVWSWNIWPPVASQSCN